MLQNELERFANILAGLLEHVGLDEGQAARAQEYLDAMGMPIQLLDDTVRPPYLSIVPNDNDQA